MPHHFGRRCALRFCDCHDENSRMSRGRRVAAVCSLIEGEHLKREPYGKQTENWILASRRVSTSREVMTRVTQDESARVRK